MLSHAKNKSSSDLHEKCEEGKPVRKGSKVLKGELLMLTGKGEGNQVEVLLESTRDTDLNKGNKDSNSLSPRSSPNTHSAFTLVGLLSI